MATNVSSEWQPDWGVPPGEILAEALEERAMTQVELARRMDRPLKTINEIIRGKAAITPETAIQLERTLGISARFWNSLETNYRAFLARKRAASELEQHAAWLDRFPVKDLARHGVIVIEGGKGETLASLLSFFGVSTPKAWERQWLEPSAAFRSSPAFAASPEAIASWLRWGEVEAARIDCGTFDSHRLHGALNRIRVLTREEPPYLGVQRAQDILSDVGVAVVLIPELSGTHVSGATRWATPAKAIVQLSMRHKTDDHLWFTLFHECAHVLQAPRRREFLDTAALLDEQGDDDEDERLADEFARNMLIPLRAYEGFVNAGDFTESSIRSFARDLEIGAGLVVGRLQRDRHVSPAHFNQLKKQLSWATER